MTTSLFPFDLFSLAAFPADDPHVTQFSDLEPISMVPPFPWGQHISSRLLEQRLPVLEGDLVECGVGEGGMSILLGRIAACHERRLHALDSFAGLPQPDPHVDNPYFRRGDYRGRSLARSLLGRFRDHVAAAGLAGTITIERGWFQRTLPRLPSTPLAFVHIDADLYGSVLVCLDALYPRIVDGGILVIDDFFHHAQGAHRAVATYFNRLSAAPLLHVLFPYSVAIIKGEVPPDGLHRAIDGNRYSFRLLRENRAFHDAARRSRSRALAADARHAACNAERLLGILDADVDAPAQVYEYWRALADWWDSMDAPSPQLRRAFAV